MAFGFIKKVFSFGKKEVVEEKIDEQAPLPPLNFDALEALRGEKGPAVEIKPAEAAPEKVAEPEAPASPSPLGEGRSAKPIGMGSPDRRARRRALPRHPLPNLRAISPSRRGSPNPVRPSLDQPNRRPRQNRSRIFRRRRPNPYRRRHLRNRPLSRRRKSPHPNRSRTSRYRQPSRCPFRRSRLLHRHPTSQLPHRLRSNRRCRRKFPFLPPRFHNRRR